MNSPKFSADVNTGQILSNHGENFGVVGMPQLIRVNIGEDIVFKIMDFAQQEGMIISIQSVTGEVSSVTIQSAMGGDIVTREVIVRFIPEMEEPESMGYDDAHNGIPLVNPPATE